MRRMRQLRSGEVYDCMASNIVLHTFLALVHRKTERASKDGNKTASKGFGSYNVGKEVKALTGVSDHLYTRIIGLYTRTGEVYDARRTGNTTAKAKSVPHTKKVHMMVAN